MNTKEYSFWDLISEYKIEIPAIQRDYAQGRKSESRIANFLINDLFETLTSAETKKINLHFVYGKIDDKHFIPLDGQQRLTTLFLLHWFLSIGFLSENDKSTLSKFTYETRPSSEDFCSKLIKEGIEYENNKKVSEQVENSKWFFLSWKDDPTISAILNMLDIIQNKFAKPNKTLFDKLIEENSPVQFHFLPLERFKLDDEIYVKMNSRGKPLTDFENFKSNFSVLFDIENKSKLDNEWLDIFWKFEKEKENININEVDKKYLNFLINATLNICAEEKDIDRKFKDNFNIFDEYKTIYSPNSETLKQLSKVLDSLISFNDREKYFESSLKENPDYWERLRFYTIMQFFIQRGSLNDKNQELYNKWVRVCTNLINNSRIEDPESFYKAIRSIKELSSNIDNLYEYLSEPKNKIESFSQKQSEEEKVKATLILQDRNWETEICDIEQHSYFTGQIGFILDFSKVEEKYSFELFKDYSVKLKILFSNLFKDNKDCLFQRALLAFGDYLVPINYCRTFCTFNESLREKNDNWRKVFDDKDKKIFLKSLLDTIHIESIEKDLQDIIDKYSEIDWKSLFIKNKGIIEYCNKYRIAKWGNKIALSRSAADNWRLHAELYSYVLYLELKKENENIYYNDRSDEESWICIKWKGKYYYVREDEKDYSFGFCEGNDDSEGLNEMQQYVEEVINKKKLRKPISI